MYFLKRFFKVVIIIFLILLVGFVGYRFYELKKEGKLDEVFASNKNDEVLSGVEAFSSGQNTTKAIDGVKNEKTTESESTESTKYVLEEKTYEDYYNKFNFDNVLLLYEGEQHAPATKEAMDVLIRDIDDPMYSKPIVVFQNFSGLSSNEISVADLDEYRIVLNQARNSIGNGTYTFTFDYVGFTTTVNKIIITKN